MSEKKAISGNAPESQNRRNAIKKIAVGVGALAGYSVLPKQWIKPVIDSIVLPAHAQTSGISLSENDLTITVESGDQTTDTVSVDVEGAVSPATAGLEIEMEFQGTSSTAGMEGHKGQSKNTAVAAVQSFFCSEAVAAPPPPFCQKYKIKILTGPDGGFGGRCDLPCGPGLTCVFVTVVIVGMVHIPPIVKYIYIRHPSDPQPTTTCKGKKCATTCKGKKCTTTCKGKKCTTHKPKPTTTKKGKKTPDIIILPHDPNQPKLP